MNLVFSEVIYKGEDIGKRVQDGLLPAFAVAKNYKIYHRNCTALCTICLPKDRGVSLKTYLKVPQKWCSIL